MKTRGALLTPPGTAALATIQIVGDQSLEMLDRIFRPHQEMPDKSTVSSRLIYGTIYEGDEIIDKVVVTADPQRQTVDINCHGGQRIVQRIMMLLKNLGVEITTWQEITPADSIAQEVASKLPQAKTRTTVLALAAQYPTGLASWCRETIEQLQNGTIPLPQAKTDAKELVGTYRLGRKLLTPPTVVLAGPVNVGKSTLANALTGKTQSIAADLPGTTRDWTVQLVDINGLGVNLVDTAGRRETNDHIEKHALDHADKKIAEADLIILVVEAEHIEQKMVDLHLHELPPTADVLIVVNKIDQQKPEGKIRNYLYVSAQAGTNLDQLRQAIAARFGFVDFNPSEPLVFTDRQFYLLTEIVHAFDMDSLIDSLKELLGD